jgi:hypothetical protein
VRSHLKTAQDKLGARATALRPEPRPSGSSRSREWAHSRSVHLPRLQCAGTLAKFGTLSEIAVVIDQHSLAQAMQTVAAGLRV